MDSIGQYIIDGLTARAPDPAAYAARSDPNKFCEHTFVDSATGDPIVQAPHHRMWQDAVWKNDRLVMWFPIEHGKTTQAKMSMCRLLGEHGDRQYAIISSKAKQAEKLTGAIKREIESNAKLRRVYPRLKPQRAELHAGLEQWGVTAMRVADCPRGTTDPSLAAYGLDGQILGARLHGVIIDNGLDKANTRGDHMRQWAREVIEDEIIGRVLKGGFVWILDTAWYEDDYMHVFAGRPGWHSIKLDAEQGMRPGDPTLWPSQFPRDRLDSRLAELGQTAYDRQYRNLALSESMGFFRQEFWDMAYARCPWIDNWSEGSAGFNLQSEFRTGLDLATRPGQEHDLTVFSSVFAAGHRRRLVHIDADRIGGVEILRRMAKIHRCLHVPINRAGGNAKFVVEDNSAQKYIVDLAKDAAHMRAAGLTPDEIDDIRVTGRTTTHKRRDQELGIPALAAGLETGRWDIAPHHETRQLREEMRVWSPDAKHYGDRLMATWFAMSDLQNSSAGFRFDTI